MTTSRTAPAAGASRACSPSSIAVAATLALLCVGCGERPSGRPGTADAVPRDTPARLAVQPAVVDLGEVARGRETVARFRLANDGGRPLGLVAVEASCGCAAFEVDTASRTVRPPAVPPPDRNPFAALPPGEQAELLVRLDTARLPAGPIERHVLVHTDSTATPLVRLGLRVRLVERLRAEPPRVAFGRVRRGDPVTRRVRLLPGASGEPPRVAAVEAPQGVRARVLETTGKFLELELSLALDAPPGPLAGEVTLSLRDGGSMRLPVTAWVAPRLLVLVRGGEDPDRLDFGSVVLGTEASRDVLLEAEEDSPPFTVSSVRFEGAAASQMRALPIEETPGRRVRVRVTWIPAGSPGPLGGSVVIETDHPDAPRIRVPLRGWAVRRSDNPDDRGGKGP